MWLFVNRTYVTYLWEQKNGLGKTKREFKKILKLEEVGCLYFREHNWYVVRGVSS